MSGNYTHRHSPVYPTYPDPPPHHTQARPSISERSWDDFGQEESHEFVGHKDLSRLTESLGASWDDVFDLVNSIVELAASSPNAMGWGQTVIGPLKHDWSRQIATSQSKIYNRLFVARERIQRIPEKERRQESFVFSGYLPPLHLLLLQVDLTQQTQRSPALMNARLWFETAARQFVLSVARNTVNKRTGTISTEDLTLAALGRAYTNALQHYTAPSLFDRCKQFKENFETLWPRMNTYQHLFAITLFKVMGTFFRNIHSHRLMGEICFYWWVPLTTEVSKELQGFNTKLNRLTHLPRIVPSHTQASLAHGDFDLSDRKKALYGFV